MQYDEIKTIKKKNQDFFKRIYISFFDIGSNWFHEFINKKLTISFTKFLKYVPPDSLKGKDILDAGCNEGYFFDFYTILGANFIVGCDITMETMIKGKNKNYGILRSKEKALKNKNFVQSDLEIMPFKGNSFDTILCFGTWHHLIQKEEFLKGCKLILKKNGYLIISDPNEKHPLRKVVNNLGIKMRGLLKEEYVTSPEITLKMLKAHGFKVEGTYFYNIFSESFARFCDLIFQKNKKLFYFFSLAFLFLFLMDKVLENTIIKIFPRFAWSYIIISRPE